jgi:3-isopropylmalate dehydratase
MLPLTLSNELVSGLMKDAEQGLELEINLVEQTITRANGMTIKFDIQPFRKECLVKGLDDIGLTLAKKDEIETFENKRSELWPWLDGIHYPKRIHPIGTNPKTTEW